MVIVKKPERYLFLRQYSGYMRVLLEKDKNPVADTWRRCIKGT